MDISSGISLHSRVSALPAEIVNNSAFKKDISAGPVNQMNKGVATAATFALISQLQTKNAMDGVTTLGVPALPAPAMNANPEALKQNAEETLDDLQENLSDNAMMGSTLSRKSKVIVALVDSAYEQAKAEKNWSSMDLKLSFGQTKAEASAIKYSGQVQRDRAITESVATVGMTAAGTGKSLQGIGNKQQAFRVHGKNIQHARAQQNELGHALNIHPQTRVSKNATGTGVKTSVKATTQPAHATTSRTTSVDTPEMPATASTQPGAVPANTRQLVNENELRQQHDRQVLRKSINELGEYIDEQGFRQQTMLLAGDRQLTWGHAMNNTAHSLGAVAGSPFHTEYSEAQATQRMAESSARIFSEHSSQKSKAADQDKELLLMLLQQMRDMSNANNDAAGAVAQNIRA